MTEQRVRDSFARQGAMGFLGASVEQVAPGSVTLILPFRDELSQQHGFFHGGIVSAMLDTACGFAALERSAPDAAVLTVEFKLNFTAPARGVLLRATGRVIKAGRTLSVCLGEAEVDGKPCATMLATMMLTTDRGLVG
jgi:uncharacterized protein (TIGR00369 family)